MLTWLIIAAAAAASIMACAVFAPANMLTWPTLASVAAAAIWIGAAFSAVRPPPAKPFAVTVPRLRLRDGRHLAYKTIGSDKDTAAFLVIVIHGLANCMHSLPVFSDPSFLEQHRIFLVGFDRPGYGESDPNPLQTLRSAADDIEQLADFLGLGSKFYVLSQSIGAYVAWACLRYIPHRLAGLGMVSPACNFWWRGLTPEEANQAWAMQVAADRWFLWIAHHLPFLTYWWLTQKLFPGPTGPRLRSRPDLLCPSDIERMKVRIAINDPKINAYANQQGVGQCICRDLMVMFGHWEFDPSDIQNPDPNNPSMVHIWQGDQDYVIPVVLSRYIHRKLTWIKYHELEGEGHYMTRRNGFWDNVMRSFLLKEDVKFETGL